MNLFLFLEGMAIYLLQRVCSCGSSIMHVPMHRVNRPKEPSPFNLIQNAKIMKRLPLHRFCQIRGMKSVKTHGSKLNRITPQWYHQRGLTVGRPIRYLLLHFQMDHGLLHGHKEVQHGELVSLGTSGGLEQHWEDRGNLVTEGLSTFAEGHVGNLHEG